jgi:cell division protein FtsB
MEIQPVDLKELVGVTLGLLIVLIPIMGATVRFAAKPLVDALVQTGLLARSVPGSRDAELERLARRVLELEQQVEKLKPELVSGVGEGDSPLALRRVRS